MAGSLTLAESDRVRYATGFITYFAQGIPQGLPAISLPVWLARQGSILSRSRTMSMTNRASVAVAEAMIAVVASP
jgi:hypothetical protein